MVNWTTDAVRPQERFSYWREVVCHTILNVGTEASSDQFWARIDGREAGGFRFAAFNSSGHEIVRDQIHLSSSPADNYLISLQRSGRCHISQNGEDFSLDAGEIAIVDVQRPFRVAFPQPVSRVLAVVPKSTLDSFAPSLRNAKNFKVSNRSAFATLIRHHMLELADVSHTLSELEVSVLTGNLFNLLALSMVRDAPVHGGRQELRLAEILLFCREQIGNPELSAQFVAAKFGISARTLQLWFRSTGHTFGKWLLERRLEASRVALRDPNLRALSISEIAYRSGFNDLSHFNKAFRAQFDQTPGEWRNKLAAAGSLAG